MRMLYSVVCNSNHIFSGIQNHITTSPYYLFALNVLDTLGKFFGIFRKKDNFCDFLLTALID